MQECRYAGVCVGRGDGQREQGPEAGVGLVFPPRPEDCFPLSVGAGGENAEDVVLFLPVW